MSGKPATGKSVIAGFVVEDLEASGVACSYYFFKHGDTSKSRLSACLRSLAFQMAMADTGVLDALMGLQEDRFRIDHENERSLWRTLFTSKVFKAATTRHFWVIDALDECTNPHPFLDPMLLRIETGGRLQIFITSRETPELCRLFSGLGSRRYLQGHISAEETVHDIERIVTSKRGSFFTENEDSRAALERRIIEKSKGSFLWTRLVLDELSTAFSEEAIEHVLDEVPRGMEPLYHRALETMSLTARVKRHAKAILTWASCVMRPLTLGELECALEIDLKETFPRLADTIRISCGQFVTVDKHGRVQMVHETAREFLLSGEVESEFAVNPTEGHTLIAKVCLEYLTKDELKPPRAGRRGPVSARPSQKMEFFAYAAGMFSTHLAKADPAADQVLELVDRFLKLNILTWIESVAETGNLGLMIRAAEDLKAYANACTVERSPLRRDVQAIRSWSVDLQRVAAKFADALIASPSAIYHRIPPFCPTSSAIHGISAFGKRLSVSGLPALPWDDRLSCLDFGNGQTSALCYGEEFLAVGLRGGRVALYHPNSCQEYRIFNHGETVMRFQFRRKSDMLASSGPKTLCVWDIRTGQKLYQFPSPRRFVALVFCDNLLMAASSQNELLSWDLDDEAVEQTKRLWRDWMDDALPSLSRPPAALSISAAHKMMAVAYIGTPVTLWDFEHEAFLGRCGKKLPSGETSTHPAVALLLNPNPSIELLAISYLDGELVILDPFTDTEIEKQRVSCHTLAASPDGRLLAGAGKEGTISIFEFDTLKLLYKVRSSDIYIKSLAFSCDGANLADLRGTQCNIRTPPILLTGTSLDDGLSVDTSSSTGESSRQGSMVKITAMTLIPDKRGVLCGQEDGSVCLYDIKSGDLTTKLYSHKAAVHTICWLPWASRAISTCLANRVLACHFETAPNESTDIPTAGNIILDARLECGSTIVQLLPGRLASKLILSTDKSDHLWDLDSAREDLTMMYDDYFARTWLQHPRSASHVICVKETAIGVHQWQDLSQVISVSLTTEGLAGLSVKRAFFAGAENVLLDLVETNGSSGTKEVCLLSCTSPVVYDEKSTEKAGKYGPIMKFRGKAGQVVVKVASAGEEEKGKLMEADAISLTRLGTIMGHISHVIGILQTADKTRLIFLDSRSWVSSVDVDEASASRGNLTSYSRHFFVPYDWFAGTRNPVGSVTAQGEIVFAKSGHVAVIRGGLEYSEPVDVRTSGSVR